MRNHAASLGLMKRGEAKVIDGWAGMLDRIAEALTDALHEKDPASLARLWRFTKTIVAPLLVVGGAVADTISIVDYLSSSERVTAIAHDIGQRADEQMASVLEWDPGAPIPRVQTATATGGADGIGAENGQTTPSGSHDLARPHWVENLGYVALRGEGWLAASDSAGGDGSPLNAAAE